ncbi:MAG TPA: hypothetical protein VN089_00455, partial [Duganella sp.]|nr:hypothetical protein [Duganella sp.]
MSTYQNFLDFFEMHNKERLDGLNEIYFSEMTEDERKKAFNYLLKMVQEGATAEIVRGLFIADPKHASIVIKELLENKKLHGEAELTAAFNLYRIDSDPSLIPIFIKAMSNAQKRLRADAAYYAPTDIFCPELIAALEGMIRTETYKLASINAVNKLLKFYGITRELVEKEEFSRLYKKLRSENPI